GVHLMARDFQSQGELGLQRSSVVFAERSGIEQLAFIKLRDRRTFLDLCVEIGLCERRFVAFVVAIAAIAIQVDHYVSPKSLAEIERQIADKLHCERVIAIYMKNRCL